MMFNLWGNVVQSAGLAAMMIGISLECIMGADIWYLFITAGSLAFAVGTKIKYFKKNKSNG